MITMIADQFETFLFDLDGVIYLGDEALPDAVDSVNRLHDRDKQIRFLTNDPRPTREKVVSRLRALGIEADQEEIVTAAWAAAAHLRQEGITTAAAVGSEGLRTELREQGVTITDESPEAVVVGADEQTLDAQHGTSIRVHSLSGQTPTVRSRPLTVLHPVRGLSFAQSKQRQRFHLLSSVNPSP